MKVLKDTLRRITEDAEVKLAGKLLRLKYNREGGAVPDALQLERESRRAARKAHGLVVEGGRAVWEEVKEVYCGKRDQGKGRKD